MTWSAPKTALVVFCAVGFVFACIKVVSAHSWYPNECCHGNDCRHAAPGEVTVLHNGYFIPKGTKAPDGVELAEDTFVPFDDVRSPSNRTGVIRDFPPDAFDEEKWGPLDDGGIHICIVSRMVSTQGGNYQKSGFLQCLFRMGGF